MIKQNQNTDIHQKEERRYILKLVRLDHNKTQKRFLLSFSHRKRGKEGAAKIVFMKNQLSKIESFSFYLPLIKLIAFH